MSQQNKTLGQVTYEAAIRGNGQWPEWELVSIKDHWEAIAATVAAAVKEEDARICDDMPELVFAGSNMRQTIPDDCAAAIRASIKEVK